VEKGARKADDRGVTPGGGGDSASKKTRERRKKRNRKKVSGGKSKWAMTQRLDSDLGEGLTKVSKKFGTMESRN